MKKVLFSNDEFNEALNALNDLLREAENISIADHKVLLYNVLQYFDSIHREPLLRIFEELSRSPEVKKAIIDDTTVQRLCTLYDIPMEPSPLDQEGTLGFVAEDQVTLLSPQKRKDWIELGYYTELEEYKLYPKNYERVNFLVSRVGSEVYAVQNQCDGSLLPIDKGTLEDHFVVCPWHGCRYDLKTGKSANGDARKLDTFPVEIEENGLLKVEIAY